MNYKKWAFLLALACTSLFSQAKYWLDCSWEMTSPFPKDFVFGAGISYFQYEGNNYNNNWRLKENNHLESITHECHDACKGYEKALDDIDLVHDIGLGAYRLSVSWERINPEPGIIDYDALDHYVKIVEKCNQRGIKVLMGLHHYVDPLWFTLRGGWTKRENIEYFVTFARAVYQALGDRVWLWATFNSPSGYAAKCFLSGEMIASFDATTGKITAQHKDFTGHANMLCNLCLAHVEVYNALKEEFIALHKKGLCEHEPQVGILKNIIQIESDSFFGSLGSTATKNLLDEPIFLFFTTGIYPQYNLFNLVKNENNPLLVDPRAPLSLDFIGLNYYSHLLVEGMKTVNMSGEIKTQNPNYTIYPEGLYYALHTINERIVQPIKHTYKKNIPIYVTENGIAAVCDDDRELFFKRYLYALHAAIQDGINVKGYFNWSLMDNYEWGSYHKKYGLYHVDFNDPERKRTLKCDAGTQLFLTIANTPKNS